MDYREIDLPKWLEESRDAFLTADKIIADGGICYSWDCYYCEFQSDINVAEVEENITKEQADFLREKYLFKRRGEASKCSNL